MYTLGTGNYSDSGAYPQVLNWFSTQQYDNGFNPSVAVDTSKSLSADSADATVVEVHQAGTDQSDLWYHVGTLFHSTSTPSIVWGPAYHVTNQSGAYVAGYAPSVSVANGQVVVAYQAGDGVLAYSFGTITGTTVSWENPSNYDYGYNPSISFVIGSFLEVHQDGTGTGSLLYRVGELNSSLNGISWVEGPVPYATGCYPSVAQNGTTGDLGEVHSAACGEAANLVFSFGYFN